MKHLSFLFFFISAAMFANGQSSNKFAAGVGFDALLPFNASPYGSATGVSAKFEIPLSSQWSLTLTPSYMVQHKNSSRIYDYFGPLPSAFPYKFVVLKAGVRYFINQIAYLETEAGNAHKTGAESKNTLIYSIGGGVALAVNPHNYLDIGIRLENEPRTAFFHQNHLLNQFGSRIGYRYKF